MRLLSVMMIMFCTLFTIHASAERIFRIGATKEIIKNTVERFYSPDGGALATMFCKEPVTAEVMIVDSRLGPSLDGKTFFFPSYEKCIEARQQVRQFYKSCDVDLIVDQATAKIQISRCP